MSIIDALKDEAAEIQALEKDTVPASPGSTDQPPAQAPEPDQQAQADRPEPEAEAEPEFTPENRGQFIRRREYETANEARKQAEARAREVEARYAQDMAKINERLASVFAAQQQQRQPEAPKAPELPDINTDPIGHFQAKTALLERQLEETRARFGTIEQTTQQTEQLRKVGDAVRNAEVEYTKSVPDYPQAQEYLMSQWAAEADAAGMPREQVIRARALEIAAVAGQRGMNPAELAYKLAGSRGYRKADAQPQPRPQQGPSIETLQRGLKASVSPSNAPGRAAPGELSAEALLRMDDAEFGKKFGGRDNPLWEKVAMGRA